MDSNIFIERMPHPFIIQVQLPRDVDNLHDLKQIVNSLNFIQYYTNAIWLKKWDNEFTRMRRKRQSHLISFRVDSPPEFKIFTDPAWLTVLLTLLANYKNIKENVPRLIVDIDFLLKELKGLTEYELKMLECAIKLFVDERLENVETTLKQFLKKVKEIRKALMNDNVRVPKIKIIKINDFQNDQ